MKKYLSLIVIIAMVLILYGTAHASALVARGTYVYNADQNELVLTIEKSNFDVGDGIMVLNESELKPNPEEFSRSWSMNSDQRPGIIGKTYEYTDPENQVTSTISLTYDKEKGIKSSGRVFIMITDDSRKFAKYNAISE